MSSSNDFLPTASLTVLRRRAELLTWLRGFFRRHGYWEVQTPLLSHDVCIDAWLEPFSVPLSSDTGPSASAAFLQTSPEFAMKRMLAAGADAIFQITSSFRQGEAGPLHSAEFTIVEWYRTGDSYHDQMQFTEELVTGFLEAARDVADQSPPLQRPIPRLTYDEAFLLACGSRVLELSTTSIRDLAAQKQVTAPASLAEADRDGWLNLLLAEVVEPHLQKQQAVFLYDYPASQAALARIRADDPPVAERFELYLQGIELCNGYQELTDANELRRRFDRQSEIRTQAGLPSLPQTSRLLKAMDAGLPECSGVALGFDRLLMIALSRETIADVIAFPFDRA